MVSNVLDEIDTNQGVLFDPTLVSCFMEIYETIKAVAVKYEERGH